MPDSYSEIHVGQLEERWRREPGSRIFLQLAEELRRGGRLDRAVEVLREGLGHQPTYLSAQVALGRCLVERNDLRDAAEVLERAVAQDPAQVVASKLLIEAYLRLGDGARARSRFDFYRLFTDRDPELHELEDRIRSLEMRELRGGAAPGREAPPFGALPAAASAPLDFAPAPRAEPREALPFGPLSPAPGALGRLLAACRAESIFVVAAPRARVEPAVAAPAPPTPPNTPGVPPETAAPESADAESAPPERSVWWKAEPAAVAPEPPPLPPPLITAPPPPAAAAPPWSERAVDLALEPEPLFAATFSPREIGAEVERETIEEPFDEVYSAAAVPAPAPATSGAASVTLAELYLEQGHFDEAERAYGAVLLDRPGDAAAVHGLSEITRRRARLAAAAAVPATAWEPEPAATPEPSPAGSLSQRKAGALRAYLERLRRATAAHVS